VPFALSLIFGKDFSLMKKLFFIFLSSISFTMEAQIKLRGLADTVGFAHLRTQMDSVVQRIQKQDGGRIAGILHEKQVSGNTAWRTVIAPHDDYSYVGYLYPLVLQNIKARTVIIFGVAHKAAKLNLENKLIFDSFTHWRGPYGNVKVSSLRESIMEKLPKDIYEVNDSMQALEHSVEAEVPFLQYYNRDVQIISILAPYMSFDRMNELAKPLAEAIGSIMKEKKLEWGKDVALLISTDAVHYGDEQWSGKNFAFYGADTAGYNKAVEHEHEIMNNCLKDELKTEKIKLFTEYTVQKENFKEYKWTWCGRYSVPVGLLTGLYLQQYLKAKPLLGTLLGYSNSLDHAHIKVDDLQGMGVTAIATIRHWVGYAAVGFK
jgi:AmmeMemoRadiSam system protein B